MELKKTKRESWSMPLTFEVTIEDIQWLRKFASRFVYPINGEERISNIVSTRPGDPSVPSIVLVVLSVRRSGNFEGHILSSVKLIPFCYRIKD